MRLFNFFKREQLPPDRPYCGPNAYSVFPGYTDSLLSITKNEMGVVCWASEFYKNLPMVRVMIVPIFIDSHRTCVRPDKVLPIGRFVVGWIPPRHHNDHTLCRVLYLDSLAPFRDGGFDPIPSKFYTKNMVVTKSVQPQAVTMEPWRKSAAPLPAKYAGQYKKLMEDLAWHREKSLRTIYEHTRCQNICDGQNPFAEFYPQGYVTSN
jgi:hypothetical protein